MAETPAGQSRNPRQLIQLCYEAGEKDDPSLMKEAVSAAFTPSLHSSKPSIIQRALQACIGWRATKVLAYIVEEQVVDVNAICPGSIFALEKPRARSLYPFLEALITHGWDIDNRGRSHREWPLVWYATNDDELMDWCLQNGASMYDDSARDRHGGGWIPCEPLLEKVATDATVETFEKLRALGAPLSERTLHQAVYKAAQYAPGAANADRALYESRMAMVRHLVENVGLDVNAIGSYVGEPTGKPLYQLAHMKHGGDKREIVRYLLEKGAIPDQKGPVLRGGLGPEPSPLEVAEGIENTRFIDAVDEWRRARESQST